MANYGPPDGPVGEPWRSERPEDGYGPPERGWQGRDRYPPGPNPRAYPPTYDNPPRYDAPPTYDNPPRYDAPYAGTPGYGPQQGYGPPRYGAPYAGTPGYGSQRGYGPQQGYGGGYAPEPQRPAYSPWDTGPTEAAGGYPAGPTAYAGDPVPPSRPSRGRGRLIAVLAAVLLLVLGGGATVLYLLDRDAPPPAASPTAPVAAESSAPAVDASRAPSGAAPESSADPRFVKVGQCVRNAGPAGGKPRLLISECAARTYEVLHRVDGRTTGEKDAAAKCAAVDGYTNWYFFDSELDTLDFVLCLKQR